MARSRTLSPLFFKDEDLAECTETARLFFLGLTTLADREGRLEDRPIRIKGEIFPYQNVDVTELLDTLASPRQWSPGSFITRYEVDGRKYIHINNFVKYQHPHPNEPKSVLPPPMEGLVESDGPSGGESPVRDAWAAFLNGKTEQSCELGIIDIETETHTWEVKIASSSLSAIRQSLGYAAAKKKTPGIILFGRIPTGKRGDIESVARKYGVDCLFGDTPNSDIASDNGCTPSTNDIARKALPSFPSVPSFPSEPSVPSGSSGVPPSPASDELDPHAFTQELVAEVQEHLPDSGVTAHPGLSMAVANLLEAGHPRGLACQNGRIPLAREDIRDAVHGWILSELGDSWHIEQRLKDTPFTLSRLLTQAFDRLPDYAEKGRAGWGKQPGGIHGLEHARAPPIEASVNPEITARHQAREEERLAKVKAWREEEPPPGMGILAERKWWEEHKRRRP